MPCRTEIPYQINYIRNQCSLKNNGRLKVEHITIKITPKMAKTQHTSKSMCKNKVNVVEKTSIITTKYSNNN